MDMHAKSEQLQKAKGLLNSVKGKPQAQQQRENTAVQLAADLLEEALKIQTHHEKSVQKELARMMNDPKGKAFTGYMTDRCFRSRKSTKVADQLNHLLKKFGIPKYLDFSKRVQLFAFKFIGKPLSFLFVPLAIYMLRRQTASVILPGERKPLHDHMVRRRAQGVKLNINHLGEAILGEEEAKHRLELYLKDLRDSDIDYVSIKISTIYSQINLLSWEQTLDVLAERLRKLYLAAIQFPVKNLDGSIKSKFVNLDMEEYKDLELTKALFKKVLSEPEFKHYSAGIVLQAYLPDSHEIQKELTEWAMERKSQGGSPIKIRIVKGANLAMEQFEASLKGWSQTPYKKKLDVDANYKRMVSYGTNPKHAEAVHLGIGSHNLFDIAYAMLLRAENRVEHCISFEMLEGMADHIRRAVQEVTGSILLYCPVAKKEDFQSAVAYLIRRLDENTGPDNFLRHTFGLVPGNQNWEQQVHFFKSACSEIETVFLGPRRKQDRFLDPRKGDLSRPFDNEPDTDFALEPNRKWAHEILKKWQSASHPMIPLLIGGKREEGEAGKGIGIDPARPNHTLYEYALASEIQIEKAIQIAKNYEEKWSAKSGVARAEILIHVADKLRERRSELIGAMSADGGKAISESDPEVSEAIDFAEYYARSYLEMESHKDLRWTARGTVLVTSPWNFPVAIPCGGMLAALSAGNCVIFKPAPETVLCGWTLINLLWEGGIPKEALQFISCVDDPVGTQLVSDPRINGIILTGATSTARLFQKFNPKQHLCAETGGKNAMIVTAQADRDLAIKDILQSAFGHSGQKCSATSLLILEREVYENEIFKRQLHDAAKSLKVGPAWNPSSKIVPLIRVPEKALAKGIKELAPGEEWLLKPEQDPNNPYLWSPGIKLGVQEGSFMQQTELFGPVLAVICADDLNEAIRIANSTVYGLTSGFHSLDETEQQIWLRNIEAGNLYVNRGTTGAVVRRQPFGGCKASSFGHGAKAGGPNYVSQFAKAQQIALPEQRSNPPDGFGELLKESARIEISADQLGLWLASLASYAFWAKKYKEHEDPTKIVGQDNFFCYVPRRKMAFRLQKEDSPLDVMRVLTACQLAKAPLHVSYDPTEVKIHFTDEIRNHLPFMHFVSESEPQFFARIEGGEFDRVRMISPPKDHFYTLTAHTGCYILAQGVLANGRYELLHYLREVSISSDYHRYGNLGIREGEIRKPIL